jgi:hypothetical protein
LHIAGQLKTREVYDIMTNITIIDLMNKPVEDHDMELQKVINDNPEYVKAQETVSELMEKLKDLDWKIQFGLDAEIGYKEALARDTAFNEGFKFAIRFILSSIM